MTDGSGYSLEEICADANRDLERTMFMSDVSVLVVDDHETDRTLIKLMLKSIGVCDFLEAANGQEALDILRNAETASIDLIICDLCMAEMDGAAFCDILRKSEDLTLRNVPILLLTAMTDPLVFEVAEWVGEIDVQHKPISREKLTGWVQRMAGYVS